MERLKEEPDTLGQPEEKEESASRAERRDNDLGTLFKRARFYYNEASYQSRGAPCEHTILLPRPRYTSPSATAPSFLVNFVFLVSHPTFPRRSANNGFFLHFVTSSRGPDSTQSKEARPTSRRFNSPPLQTLLAATHRSIYVEVFLHH